MINRQRTATADEVEAALDALDRRPRIVSVTLWPSDLAELDQPGLYSWWVDARGAEMLTRGLAHEVAPGRIYAGLTGATKWPSGNIGKNTLRKRIRGHVRGRIRGSTFRLTLASVLREQLALAVEAPKVMSRASEQALTAWVGEHLSVAVHPVADPEALADLARQVLKQLDPPLNLDEMPVIPLRARLSALRNALIRSIPSTDAGGSGFNLQFDGSEIAELARRYTYATDHRASQAGRQAHTRGYYTKCEFMVVCRWKSPRSSRLAEANSSAAIRRATTIALRADDEVTRMRALTKLRGVGVPIASTLLHFAFPRRYPILDWRALESLGQKPHSTCSVTFWLGYLDACRLIARANDVHIRTLDKALWQRSREAGLERPPVGAAILTR